MQVAVVNNHFERRVRRRANGRHGHMKFFPASFCVCRFPLLREEERFHFYENSVEKPNIWIELSVEAERLIATINNKLKEDFSNFQLWAWDCSACGLTIFLATFLKKTYLIPKIVEITNAIYIYIGDFPRDIRDFKIWDATGSRTRWLIKEWD